MPVAAAALMIEFGVENQCPSSAHIDGNGREQCHPTLVVVEPVLKPFRRGHDSIADAPIVSERSREISSEPAEPVASAAQAHLITRRRQRFLEHHVDERTRAAVPIQHGVRAA